MSELTLGGLIKHVSATEAEWAAFIVDGPKPGPEIDWDAVDWSDPPPEVQAFMDSHRMTESETLEGLLAGYEQVAARTDALVESLPDLDVAQPLPKAPWFEAGAVRSARRTFLHIIAETAQHSGHADIIREVSRRPEDDGLSRGRCCGDTDPGCYAPGGVTWLLRWSPRPFDDLLP